MTDELDTVIITAGNGTFLRAQACGRINKFGGADLLYVKKVVLVTALCLLILPGSARALNDCLRVMPIEELTRQAILIARIKVHKVEKARYRGEFNQLAELLPVDVIDGDFTLKEIFVLARSGVRCAEDNYNKEDEMLVFLEPQDSLFHTVNYQYGQFQIAGDLVKGWRDKTNKPIDKPYAEVKSEIQAWLRAARSPKPPVEQTQKPTQPVKPPIP